VTPDRLRRLLADATPGPWHVHGFQDAGETLKDIRPADSETIIVWPEGCFLPPMEEANLALIALTPEIAAWAADAHAFLCAVDLYGGHSDAAREALLARYDEIGDEA